MVTVDGISNSLWQGFLDGVTTFRDGLNARARMSCSDRVARLGGYLLTRLPDGEIALDDPRVTEIYDRAPWSKRPRLLRLRMGREPQDGRPWQPQFTALLTCDDPDARDEAMQDVWMFSRIAWDDAWIDAMTVILPEGPRRDAFASIFKRDTSADLYWIDDGE